MPFIRKPKPYTRGRGAARFPSQAQRFGVQWPTLSHPQNRPRLAPTSSPLLGQSATRQSPSQVGPSFRAMSSPGGRWLGALAVLGAVVCVLVGGSMVMNVVAREAQFQGVAAHLDALSQPTGGQ